jgi:Fe-S cluster assembly protein SufD
MTALQGAVESTAPVSRLHEHQSFELADFPVPAGREEEWRFTPLRRLRGDTVLRECKVTRGRCFRAERGHRRLGSAYLPADRVSARAYASFAEATVITVPAEAVASGATWNPRQSCCP